MCLQVCLFGSALSCVCLEDGIPTCACEDSGPVCHCLCLFQSYQLFLSVCGCLYCRAVAVCDAVTACIRASQCCAAVCIRVIVCPSASVSLAIHHDPSASLGSAGCWG